MTQPLSFRLTHEPDGTAVLCVRGEVDISTAAHLGERVMAAFARHPRLVLDLSGAMFFDASGLRVLHALHAEATRRQRPAPTLRGVRPLLAKSLKATGMSSRFTVEPGPATARMGGPGVTRRPGGPAAVAARAMPVP